MSTTRITGRYVIGFDGTGHRLLENGEVVYQDDRIIFCGFDYSGPVDHEIDAGNAVVGPGFIDLDALADLDSTVLAFDNGPAWRCGRVWASSYVERGPREVYDRRDEDFMKRYAYAQLLHNGITTALPITSLLYREWAETYDEFARAADIAAEMGLRVYLGPAYRTGLSMVRPDGSFDMHWDEARGLQGLDDAVRFAQRFDNTQGGLVRAMLAPDRIEGCTRELLERSIAASNALQCPVRLHCCQSQLEVDTMEQRFGTSSLALLQDIGFLGPRTLLPHGLFLGGAKARREDIEQELNNLRDSGSTLVHCPIVFGRSGKALNSFSRLRARGINIGLGTDTFPADLIRNMHAGVMLNRVLEDDAQAVSAADFYNAATLDGARALGREDLGRLAPGAKADITVFDLTGFHLGQRVDPIQTMIMNGSGSDFKTVIVDGRIRVQDYRIEGLPYADWHQRAQDQYERLRASYPERTHLHPPVDEIFTPSFAPLFADKDR
jgi:cytosine/adenosine deaminase-related metal-dependent hydrolase